MTLEVTKRSAASSAAHAMRAAAIRLARERAAEEVDPAQAYGCVDWFRYDAAPAQEANTEADSESANQSQPGLRARDQGSDDAAPSRS